MREFDRQLPLSSAIALPRETADCSTWRKLICGFSSGATMPGAGSKFSRGIRVKYISRRYPQAPPLQVPLGAPRSAQQFLMWMYTCTMGAHKE